MRFQACLRPHTLHGRLADAERFGHLAARPVRAAVGGFLPRPARDARLHLGGRDARLAAFVAWIEARDPILLEALFPTRDGRSRRAQAAHDLDVGLAVGQRQNQPGAEDITGRQCARLRPLSQLHSLFVGYLQQLSILSHNNETDRKQ
jgi:hypothetical protein